MTNLNNKIIKWLCAVGLSFTVGLIIGEYTMKRSVIDDCRILRATRFGEIYISCGTAQKL